MMKIAFILPSLANKGPAIVAQDLCRGLVERGHACKVFYFDDIVELSFDCPVERISFWHKFDFLQWDIVHSHMLRPDLWVWIHKPCIKRARARFITTLHNPISYKAFRTYFSIMYSFIGCIAWNLALTRMDKIVALNMDTKQTLAFCLEKKTVVIFNGRDIEISKSISCEKHQKEIEQLREGYTILGTVCGMYYRKGISQIVESLALLPSYALVAVGDGPQLEEWKLLSEQLGVADRCYWVGYTKNATQYYSLFDIFMLPSRSEGFPLAMIEAAAYGLPIVLSDIPIFRAIASEKQVLFFELNNIQNLSDVITVASKDRAYYKQQVKLYYQEHLTEGIMTENYINNYKEIIK